MGPRMNNIGKAFANPKIRGIFIILIIAIVIVFGVSYLRLKTAAPPGVTSSAQVTRAPQITSIPGSEEASREYVKLQEEQNIQLSEEAAKKGTAAIPTITRTTYVDTGVGTGDGNGCSVEELKRARNSGVTAAELRCRGCSLAALKAAGFTAGELREAGFSAAELKAAGFNAAELKAAGFNASELAQAGFSPNELAQAGFSAAELKAAGFSADALKRAGFGAADLRAAGFSANELAKAGFDGSALAAAGFSAADLKKAGMSDNNLKSLGFSNQAIKSLADAKNCSVAELRKLRARGIKPEALRNLGCSVAALRAAGFTAAELKAAGYSAKELKDAGFSAAELKAAGFSAKDLKDAGFSAKDLKDAGFSAADLKDAGFSAGELKRAGFSADALKAAGFSAKELRDAGFSPSDLQKAGFSAADLKAAGFSDGDLVRAGFDSGSVAAPGVGEKNCSVEQLRKDRANGVSALELKNRGCSAAAMKAAGFTAAELKAAGFSAQELKDAGFSAKDLAQAGFSAQELKKAGFSDPDLAQAGFSQEEIAAANLAADARVCSVENLRQARAQGVSAQELKNRGCSAAAMKAAGFTAAELKAAGFSAQELKDAGFSNQDLAQAGFSPDEIAMAQHSGDATATDAGAGVPTTDTEQPSWQQQLAALREQEAQQMSAQEYQDKIKQLQQAMATQANDLFAAWSPLPTQQYVQATADQNGDGKKASAGDGKDGDAAAVNANVTILKAGSILFAVLDTAINSDEKSPVLATIVDGDLKGTRVLGDFRRVDKKVVLQFNTLNIPNLPSSINFSAVAIDPNTARTALANHVDNHYLLRYGTVFAASFMSGIGQAVQDSGNSVQINTSTGENVNFHGSTNLAKAAVVGLGEVGNKFSEVLTPLINKPPTITVKAGSGIGILLTTDLSIPKK